jgi:ABC-type Fe3+ transport system permease subunit
MSGTTSFTVLVLGCLASLPDEPFEAASIDGASAWQQLWFLTVPLLRPLILVILLFRSYELIRVYDIVFAVTAGGPGRLTETISFHIFNRMFNGFQVGYASAVSYVLFAISLAWSLDYQVVGIRGTYEQLPRRVAPEKSHDVDEARARPVMATAAAALQPGNAVSYVTRRLDDLRLPVPGCLSSVKAVAGLRHAAAADFHADLHNYQVVLGFVANRTETV